MAAVTVKLLKTGLLSKFYTTNNPSATARSLMAEGAYHVEGTLGVVGAEGEEAAEEVFDLTNNPYREEERDRMYGTARSVAVGDVLNVDGVDFVCCSLGWTAL